MVSSKRTQILTFQIWTFYKQSFTANLIERLAMLLEKCQTKRRWNFVILEPRSFYHTLLLAGHFLLKFEVLDNFG